MTKLGILTVLAIVIIVPALSIDFRFLKPIFDFSPLSETCFFNLFQTYPKTNSSELYTFGGTDKALIGESLAHRLNGTSGKWQNITGMPAPRPHFCGVVVGDKIYMFGGAINFSHQYGIIESSNETSEANVYDTSTDTYKALRPMPEPRISCGAAALNGYIYVAGGSQNLSASSSVFRYDIHANRWSTVQSMNRARSICQLVELNGRVYALGGWSFLSSMIGSVRLNDNPSISLEKRSVEVYDPLSDKWSFVGRGSCFYGNFPKPFGATVHEGKIYVLDGNCFEVYTPCVDKWHSLGSPGKFSHEHSILVSMNGKLLTMAQSLHIYWTRGFMSVWTYDKHTREWTEQNNTEIKRLFHSAFVVNH